MSADVCVCIPARNEAECLPRLLTALAAQDVVGAITVAICINNSEDGSADQARAAARLHPRVRVTIDEVAFPPSLAHSGSARRRAMDLGASLVGPEGLLVSTDADCRPPETWLSAILAAMAGEVTVIGGRIVIDPADDLDPRAAALRALWEDYWEAVRAIEDAIDPLPWDPAPRHGDHTGASLAITRRLYEAAGGVPLLETGEDRALVRAAIALGGKLAHPASVWTYVSPRQIGRATGGMADDMRRLQAEAEAGTAPLAPAFVHWHKRAEWRRSLRGNADSALRIALEEPKLPAMPLDMPLMAAAR